MNMNVVVGDINKIWFEGDDNNVVYFKEIISLFGLWNKFFL